MSSPVNWNEFGVRLGAVLAIVHALLASNILSRRERWRSEFTAKQSNPDVESAACGEFGEYHAVGPTVRACPRRWPLCLARASAAAIAGPSTCLSPRE